MLNMLNMLDFLGEPRWSLIPPEHPMLNISWVLDSFRQKSAPNQGNVKHVGHRQSHVKLFPGF